MSEIYTRKTKNSNISPFSLLKNGELLPQQNNTNVNPFFYGCM
jgi:hypothetical protein